MTAKKVSSESVDVAQAVIFYSATHRSSNNIEWKTSVYLLDDDYLLVIKNGGTTVSIAFTDLTTTRYELDRFIADIKRGIYDD